MQDAVDKARKSIHEPSSANLEHIFGVFRLLDYLAQNWITSFTADELLEETVNLLRELCENPERLESADFEVWPDNYSENSLKVIEVLGKTSKAAAALHAEQERQAILNALLTGEKYFNDQRLRPVFTADVQPHWVLEQIKANGVASVERVQSLFRMRARLGGGIADYVGSEKGFAIELARLIEAEVVLRRPMDVLDSELLVLARMLKQFAREMEMQHADGNDAA